MDLVSLKNEMQDVLEQNILRFWLHRMVDEENGGFYGRIDGQGLLQADAEKGAILNARILWAFSAAYRVLGKPEYLEAATRAKRYLIDHFFDGKYGGVYWSLDSKGMPLDTKKQFYAIGFAIYGLSEYVRATKDAEALDYALDLFDTIEEHAFDHKYNGYIEACTRDWGEIADMRLSELDANYPKSQNTHLHIIEPYTNLFRCLKEMRQSSLCNYVPSIGAVLPVDITVPQEEFDRIGAALRNLVNIFTDRILNPETHHLDLFFENDWTRGAGALESYGHDIECSWLLHEAALVLDDSDLLRRV
ncbi:MAG: AGE family epimerase/isomerase, partial [Prevotella sp.]|nr:AGE family epimerase/isomerase [Prevotella sp.]